jgi:hypothetical protein
MRYRRSGAGRVVVMIGRLGGEPWPGLGDALAARFRVIEPDVPERADLGWLAGFLDGLGMRRLAVVAADPWCVPLLQLVADDVDRFARVVLVPDGACETGAAHEDAIVAAGSVVPLLVAPRELPAADALIDVALFLEGQLRRAS